MGYENQKIIGQVLRNHRVTKHQTLAEVSGAVEIDIETLSSIEDGRLLPEEEILVTLISFLKIPDDDAKDIFKKAGYFEDETELPIPAIVPALYADEVKVTRSKDGVIIDFSQPSTEGIMSTFRFGMNKNLAGELVKELMISLTNENNQPKRISSVTKSRIRSKKRSKK